MNGWLIFGIVIFIIFAVVDAIVVLSCCRLSSIISQAEERDRFMEEQP